MALDETFVRWMDAHSWFGKDKKKTKEIIAIGTALRWAGCTLDGNSFMDKCEQIARYIDGVKNEKCN